MFVPPGFFGTDSFAYVAADSDMPTAAATPCTVTITVYPVPVAQNDSYILSHDAGVAPGALSVSAGNGVLANDSEPAGNTLYAYLASGPQNGSVYLSSDGSFTYYPDGTSSSASDSFTYTAYNGLAYSAPATVTIQLNTAPVAADDGPYTVTEGGTIAVSASNGVLANDSDVEGRSLTAVLVPGSGPAGGTLALSPNGSFTYTPNSGFSGADSFSYYANDGYATSDPAKCSLYVVADTTVTLTSDPSPSVYGEPVTFTATVSLVGGSGVVPTGSVRFYNETTGQDLTGSPAPLVSGRATLTVADLGTGTDLIQAIYLGDPNCVGSSSDPNPPPTEVDKATTMTSIATDLSPADYGQAVQFTASVSAVSPAGGIPTGSVQFYDADTGVPLSGSPVQLDSGVATLTVSNLAIGQHDIAATYDGDGSCYLGSPSDSVSQAIMGYTTTSITSTENPSMDGDSVTLTATVVPKETSDVAPTGEVLFYDATTGESWESSVTSAAGSTTAFATMTTTGFEVGTHTIYAYYQGDSNFHASLASDSGSIGQTAMGTAALGLTSSPNPSFYGDNVTFSLVVSPVDGNAIAEPTGNVYFYDGPGVNGNPAGGILLGSSTLAYDSTTGNAEATFATSSLAVGIHTIGVVYAGDQNFCYGGFATVLQTVNQYESLTVADHADAQNTITVDPDESVESLTVSESENGSAAIDISGSVWPDTAAGRSSMLWAVYAVGDDLSYTLVTGGTGDFSSDSTVDISPGTYGTSSFVVFAGASGNGNPSVTNHQFEVDVGFPPPSGTLVSLVFNNKFTNGNNDAVVHADDFMSEGSAVSLPGNADWAPGYNAAPISYMMGTTVSVVVTVNVQPKGVRYSLSGAVIDYPEEFVDCMAFSDPNWHVSTGGDESFTLYANVALPDYVLRGTPVVHWTITFKDDPSDPVDVGESNNEIFVLVNKPISTTTIGNNYNAITDKRLEGAVDAAYSATDQYSAARISQYWLPAHNPWGANKPGLNVDAIWSMLDGSASGQCNEAAELHALILNELGVAAQARALIATPESETAAGTARSVPIGGTLPAWPYAIKEPPNVGTGLDGMRIDIIAPLALVFDFGTPNHNTNDDIDPSEGGVLVGDKFYTEGSSSQSNALIVGVSKNGCEPEYDALIQLAGAFGGLDSFERWAMTDAERMNFQFVGFSAQYELIIDYSQV